MSRLATSSSRPSRHPPAVNLQGGPKNESALRRSHKIMRQLLVRIHSCIQVNDNDVALNKRLVLNYAPEIDAAVSMAKWAGGSR